MSCTLFSRGFVSTLATLTDGSLTSPTHHAPFINNNTADEAQRAINELTDTDLCGRKVFVREDRAKEDRPNTKK
jgi:hypothetical protein